jgi:uncharacterized protein YecE (DUF72 family)
MAPLPLLDLDENPFRARLKQKLSRLAARGIYFGGSSWKYPGWLNQIYTESRYLTRGKLSRKKFESACLEEYAEVFPAVGGDFSFYNFPTPEQWTQLFQTAPKLLFGLKAPEMITVRQWPSHPRYGTRGGSPNDHFLDANLMESAFLELLAPYQRQVGIVMLEFGSMAKSLYPAPEAFVEDLDHFLGALPLGFRYAVEVRNAEYLCDAYFQCLRENHVAHVFTSWSRMPSLEVQVGLEAAYTADFVVARALLRPGRAFEQAVKLFQPYTHVQQPYPEAREALAQLAHKGEQQRGPAFLFVNNRFEGNSPQTIDAVADMLLTESDA